MGETNWEVGESVKETDKEGVREEEEEKLKGGMEETRIERQERKENWGEPGEKKEDKGRKVKDGKDWKHKTKFYQEVKKH